METPRGFCFLPGFLGPCIMPSRCLALRIHMFGLRRASPRQCVRCGGATGIPFGRTVSHFSLFGWVRAAFLGAVSPRAHGGREYHRYRVAGIFRAAAIQFLSDPDATSRYIIFYVHRHHGCQARPANGPCASRSYIFALSLAFRDSLLFTGAPAPQSACVPFFRPGHQ